MLDNLAGKLLEPGAARLGDQIAVEVEKALRAKFASSGLLSPTNEVSASALQLPAIVQPLAERENVLARERHQFALARDSFQHELSRFQAAQSERNWSIAKWVLTGFGIGAGCALVGCWAYSSSRNRRVIVRQPRPSHRGW